MSRPLNISFPSCSSPNHVLKLDRCSCKSLYAGTLSSEGCSHHVAVKIYRTSKDISTSAQTKLSKLISCSRICRNISPFYGFSVSKDDGLFALMPFHEASLAKLMRHSKLTFHQSLRFAIDVARGVAELHAVDVLCLNLKPSSLFCHENGSIIVGDYGIRSILKEEEDLLTVAPRYAPPEMCTDKTFWPSVEFDSWSFGCILVEMFTGKCLWDGMTDSEILNSMKNEKLPPHTCVNSTIDTIIRECLEFDICKRPSFSIMLANLLKCQMGYDHDLCRSFSSVSINWTKTSALNVFTNLLGSVCKDDADCVRSMLTGLTQEDLQTIFNCKDSCGQTLLHVACNNDAMKCLEELLEFGADPQAVDKNGNSILHTTILTESTEAGLKILHKCKGTATMSLLNGQKKTPLHLCVERLNMDLVSTWADISNDTEKNASVDVSGCGGTALCMAAALNERESLRFVHVLLAAGANPKIMDDSGQTALHIAAMKGNHEVLKIILKGRETELVNITNGRGRTPLHVALMKGSHSCVRTLLSFKACCNVKDDLGENALHMAATAMQSRGNGTNRDLFFEMLPHSSINAVNCKNYRCLKPNQLLKMLPTDFFDNSMMSTLKDHGIDIEIGVFEYDKDTEDDKIVRRIFFHKPCKIEDVQEAGLIDAKWAGGPKSKECTLIVTEGESAMLFAQKGIDTLGNPGLERYGVYPLNGKPPNVTEGKHDNNQKIQHIMRALGLVLGTERSLAQMQKSLRYGHLMFMTDQDYDGFHIKGLLLNAFNRYFRSTLKLPQFFQDFITPIIKASSKEVKDETKTFMSINEFENWARGVDLNSWNLKYYKGLASHDPNETTQYFQDMKSHVRSFYLHDEFDSNYLNLAFDKKKVDERGLWIKRCKKGNAPDFRSDVITFRDFINKELILYFIADIERSIPSAIDGLKPSQRKVLFVLLEKIPEADRMKVEALAARVSELSSYRHGLDSLEGVIIAMAQSYAGANNISLLEQGGHFGGRGRGGACHGKPRYLDTFLSPIVRLLFPKADYMLLQHLKEDGLDVEPKCYVPIVPLVLINGGMGIGTGYSCTVPSYDPLAVITNTRRLINGDAIDPMIPWYQGFDGEVTWPSRKAHTIEGVYESYDTKKIRIVEIPIGLYYDQYEREVLCKAKKDGKIKAFERKQRNGKPIFEVELCANMPHEEIIEAFKLRKRIQWNINLLNAKGRIICYSSIEQVFIDFYKERLHIYERRKIAMVADLTNKIERLQIQTKQVASIHLQEEMAKLSKERARLSENKAEIELWKEDLDALEKALKPTP